MLSITIDWLAVTFKDFYDENGEARNEAKTFIDTYASHPTVLPTQPRNGYTAATIDDCGVVVQWNDDYTSMGHHVVFAGSVLRNLFQIQDIRPDALLHACVNARGSISRLDLAKDATGQAIDLEAIYQSFKQNGTGGSAEKIERYTGIDGGYTIYIGSRQSERFIRIYDKAAESKLPGQLWTRFELETKGRVAQSLATQLCNTSEWGSTFDGVVSRMANQKGGVEWGKFFAVGTVPIGIPKIERYSDRERWIETQVIAAVARHYIDNPNSEAIARLLDTLLLIAQQRQHPPLDN